MTSKDTLYHAADLKFRMKQLEDEYDMLKPSIEIAINELASKERKAIKVGELGTFQIDTKKTWTYSEELQLQQAQIKEAKKTEEAEGVATFEEASMVKFIINKE